MPSLVHRTLGLPIQSVYLSLIWSILTGHMSPWKSGVRAGSFKGHERHRRAAKCCHLQHPSCSCIISSKSFSFQIYKNLYPCDLNLNIPCEKKVTFSCLLSLRILGFGLLHSLLPVRYGVKRLLRKKPL